MKNNAMHTFSLNQPVIIYTSCQFLRARRCFSQTKCTALRNSLIHITSAGSKRHKPHINSNIKLIIHLLDEQPQFWPRALSFNLSVKPCNKAEIHFRSVLSHQSAECLHGDQIEQREGNNSDSAEGLKQLLIKYIPLMMQTLILATVCHSIHQQFSLRIIVGDASGM